MTKVSAFLGFFSSLIGILGLSACFSQPSEDSSTVDQDRIYVSYRTSFDGNTNKTTVAVRFRFGNLFGTPLRLDSPARITFNDDSLTYHEFFDEYQRDYAGFVSKGIFRYTDNRNQTFENAVVAPRRVILSANITIGRTQDFELGFGSDALVAGEQVDVSLRPQLTTSKSVFASEDRIGKTTVKLESYQLKDLAAGEATLTFKRTYQNEAQNQSGAGSDMQTVYHHEKVNVTIN